MILKDLRVALLRLVLSVHVRGDRLALVIPLVYGCLPHIDDIAVACWLLIIRIMIWIR